MFFVETENNRFDEDDMYAYAGKRVEWPELLNYSKKANLSGWQAFEDHCHLKNCRWVVGKEARTC